MKTHPFQLFFVCYYSYIMSIEKTEGTRLDGTPAVAVKKRVGKTPAKVGRPSDYTKEKGDQICELITEGKSLRTVCKEEGMPSIATIFKWQRDNPEFLNQYTRAKEEQADTNAEELQDISQKVLQGVYDPAAARVAADILKWSSSKLKPKKYGDKIDHTTNGKDLPTPILGTIQQNYAPNDVIDLE